MREEQKDFLELIDTMNGVYNNIVKIDCLIEGYKDKINYLYDKRKELEREYSVLYDKKAHMMLRNLDEKRGANKKERKIRVY